MSSRIRKARAGLRAAAVSGSVFHLWTHPFNLSSDRAFMLAMLETILRDATAARDRGELVMEFDGRDRRQGRRGQGRGGRRMTDPRQPPIAAPTSARPRTAREHRFYLEADLASNAVDAWHWYDRYRYPIIEFQRLLRHVEYLEGRGGPVRLLRLIQAWRLKQLGMKLGFSIPRGVFGPGLSLAHYGSIVVNGDARVGRNARLHSDVNIGVAAGASPRIGDDVYFGPGAKVFGGITVGDGAVIGANAVVNRDVAAGAVVAGVPARVIADAVKGPALVIDGCAVAARRLGYDIEG